MRERDDPAVRAYLEAENAWADHVLAPTLPLQEVLYNEMLGRIKETDLSVPYQRGDWWYYTRTETGKQYAVHCRRLHGMTQGHEEVLLDLNVLAEGKSFMALGDFAISDDGMRLAYSTDETGFRQYTMAVKDLASGTHLPLQRERVTSIAWDANDRALLYGVEHPETKRSHQIWRHDFADPSAPDVLVHEEEDEAFNVGVHKTRSRQWLVIHSGSHTTSEARVRPVASDGDWQLVIPRVTGIEYDLSHHGEDFYVRINDAGRNFRLIRMPAGAGRLDQAVEVIPHREAVMLEGHECFRHHMVIHEREGGVPQIAIRDMSTGLTSRIAFPEPAYECHGHANPEFDSRIYRFAYQSMITPASVFDYDMDTGERTLLKQQEVVGGYDSSRYRSERRFAIAADGTQIPISLVYRADTTLDGSAAGLLHGYGAYGYPYPVSFSSNRLSLIDRGMVIAIAHIRGGGELGKPWHDAGRMGSKSNTFTDFVTCAEYLVNAQVISRGRLGIEGGSAGGLLMGAVLNLRPDLFGAVLSQVPFVDVINTMSDPSLPLTVGEYEEWGNPGEPEHHAWMRSYDPYGNLQAAEYPPTLVRTALNDSQVMYWEPAKYVAKLRTLHRGTAPVLFLTNLGAGHGGASGRYDRLREIATDYAFVLAALRVGEVELAGS